MKRILTIAARTALISVFAWVVLVPAASALGQTVVTIGFDDGVADQYGALPILNAHGMHATFYINSGAVGDSLHMTWAQLTDLYTAGNEIGGHGLTHANLKNLKAAGLKTEINTDRLNLYNHGFLPVSFAYPFGNYNATVEQALKTYGYLSGRCVSGVNEKTVFAETIPPLDPFATRTPANVKQGTTLATIESMVTAAEQHGGGWVQLVFHHLGGADVYSVSVPTFTALLDWLQLRAANGTVVETVTQVIGGTFAPPVP
jgi:peptidoglycan/xylan/chitin deacetylase (PgdA/CDA1 family)